MSVAKPMRIIWHWTGGGPTASDLDRAHYHFIIDQAGTVHEGNLPPEENDDTMDGIYAAHARRANTGAIGVSMCGMAGARERPFDPGAHLLQPVQVDTLAALCASLCDRYRIPVRRDTVLSHAEVQPTLGIQQAGKWDTAWLPGMDGISDPVQVGDVVRQRILGALGRPVSITPAPLTITDTRTLQLALARLETAPGPADGVWGPKTLGALRALFLRLGVTQIAPGDVPASYAVVQAALNLSKET